MVPYSRWLSMRTTVSSGYHNETVTKEDDSSTRDTKGVSSSRWPSVRTNKVSSGQHKETVSKEDVIWILVNMRPLEALRIEKRFSHVPLVSKAT